VSMLLEPKRTVENRKKRYTLKEKKTCKGQTKSEQE
jgi:hypothetical protein